jgi:hypothetical protein
LAQAIRTGAGGGTYLHPKLGARALASSDAQLTGRVTEVLRLLALGHANAEIAEQLYLGVHHRQVVAGLSNWLDQLLSCHAWRSAWSRTARWPTRCSSS